MGLALAMDLALAMGLGTGHGLGYWPWAGAPTMHCGSRRCSWARPVSWGTVVLGPGLVRGDAVWRGTTCDMVYAWPSLLMVRCLLPNARRELLLEAGATKERTL